MAEKIVEFPVFCHRTMHGIVPGNKKAGIEVGLQQNMNIEKGIEQVKLNKQKGIDQMPQPKNNDCDCNKYSHDKLFCGKLNISSERRKNWAGYFAINFFVSTVLCCYRFGLSGFFFIGWAAS